MSWSEYWNSNSNINYKILSKWSEFYCKGINNLNKLNIDDNVLDYGAGTGEISAYISSQVKSVLAYDNSEAMHILCKENMLEFENVHCSTELNKNHEITFILINSVLQYLNQDELDELLKFASEETSASKMIISDIVPDNYNAYFDAANNLFYSLKNKFFFIYLFFLVKEFIMRNIVNKAFFLNTYNEDFLISKLRKNGWNIELIDNLSPSINRYSLYCHRSL